MKDSIMKAFKKLFLTFSIFVIFSFSAFAKSGLEFILNIPIGAGFIFPSKSMKNDGLKDWYTLDAGVEAQLGYMFQIKDGFGISLLGEVGYSLDNYVFKYSENSYFNLDSYNIRYDSIKLGLFAKFNIKRFSIGIGGGAKIPMTINYNYSYRLTTQTIPPIYSVSGVNTETIENTNSSMENEWFDYVYDIETFDKIEYPIIYYAKITLDYSILFNKNIAMNIGLYIGYDFMPKEYYYSEYTRKKPKNYGTFDFGLQIGFRFASDLNS